MKKILCGLIILTMMVSTVLLASCGDSVDQRFNDAYVQGLDARWQLVYAQGKNSEDDALNEDPAYIEAELEHISEFKSETFENEELGKLAKEYISLLEEFLDLTKNAKGEELHNIWTEKFADREYLISEMDPHLNVKFEDGVEQNAYDSIVQEGKIIGLEKNLKFELKSEQYGVKEYTAEVNNSTDIDFKTFTVDIALIDKDGKTIGTEHAFTTNWGSGTVHRFTFSTKKTFSDYKIVSYDFTE